MKNRWLSLSLLVFLWSCQTPSPKDGQVFSLQFARAYAHQNWEQVPHILKRIKPPSFPADTFSVLALGAKADGLSNTREFVGKAIDSAARKGGGVVYFPPGNYFIDGPIHLKSNVNLHLAKGARLIFSNRPEAYLPAVKVRWEGTVCYNYSPLIYAYQQKNIAISGKGIIDGNAGKWSMEWRKLQKPDKKRLRQMGNDTIPVEQRVFAEGFLDLNNNGKDDGFGDGQAHYLRPSLIVFYECRNILLEDFTAQDSPFWTIHPVFSMNITIRGLTVKGKTLNDDGIDPDSCEDVLIEHNDVETHDDAISIKAGRDQDAWKRPGSRNIVVRYNSLKSGVNALCIGSEMSGGVENVFMADNKISQGKHALNFKCNLDRGGEVKNIFIRNNKVDSCQKELLIFRMDYHGYRGNHYPTRFSNFFIENLQAEKTYRPFKIIGVKEAPISRIWLSDIAVKHTDTSSIFTYVEDILLDDVKIAGELVSQALH